MMFRACPLRLTELHNARVSMSDVELHRFLNRKQVNPAILKHSVMMNKAGINVDAYADWIYYT